jgi:acyl-CoA synthetase (AMP-forming)/AMP-acid ligase II
MTFDIRPPLFHDMIRLNGRWYPNKPAIIFREEVLTWGALDSAANQVANGLWASGIGREVSVALLMTNCTAYVEIMYGVLKAGAVIVPLNLAVNDAGIVGMLRDSAARILFCTPDQMKRVDTFRDQLDEGLAVICVGQTDVEADFDYAAWKEGHPDSDPAIPVREDDPCNIIYSSGTTGVPKGIKHAYRRRIQSMYELALAHRYHFGAISICPIGLYSNIAWASLFCALIVGGTCVVQDRFDEVDWIETVKRYKITHTFMVPIQFQRVLDAPNFTTKAVASFDAIISGGAPLFESLKARVIDNFRCAVIELYGLTEGFMTTLQPEEAEGRLASVGKPVRGHDFVIVDDADQVRPWGETGEICVRSVHWMVEYHNRPDATREAEFIDTQGIKWLRTGDIGRTDADGYLYITDRKKDMIVSGGQNIYPVDIEAVMVDHPAVQEVAVIGLADPKWGEAPVAIVVARAEAPDSLAGDILDWTNARVGKRQRLREVFLAKDLPRNPNGKVLKRDLRLIYGSPDTR